MSNDTPSEHVDHPVDQITLPLSIALGVLEMSSQHTESNHAEYGIHAAMHMINEAIETTCRVFNDEDGGLLVLTKKPKAVGEQS